MKNIVTPVPAATILLVRDGSAGLEVLMSKKSHAVSFAANALVFPGGKIDEQDKVDAKAISNVNLAAHRIAALRELHEECGITYKGHISELIHYAHWITPAHRPKRFDVHFFIGIADGKNEKLTVDGGEIVHADWYRPQDIIDRSQQDGHKLVLATLMNLKKLAHYQTVDEISEMANQNIVCVTPKLIDTPAGQIMQIPKEAGYGEWDIPVERFRFA